MLVVDTEGTQVDIALDPNFRLIGSTNNETQQFVGSLNSLRTNIVPLNQLPGTCHKSLIAGIVGCETTLPLCNAIRTLHQQHLAPEGRIRVQICNFSEKQVCDNLGLPTGQGLFSEYINPNNCHLSIPNYYSIITDRSPNALDLDLVNYQDFNSVKLQLSGIIRNVYNLNPNEMVNAIQQTLNDRLPNLQLNSFTVINQTEEINVPIAPQQVNNY